MPLKDEELAKKGQMQFPTVIGGVVPVVNIKGIAPGQLRLNGQVLGDIYLGKITKWNDAAHQGAEPRRCRCPTPPSPRCAAPTAPAPASCSPTTCRKVNAEWKAKVGEGTAVNWPTGAGGKGNEGVAAFVGRLPNSIGYVEYAYVKQNKMTYALMQNAAGQFVAPDDSAFKAAAAGADWSKSFYQILTNQPGAQSWPITGATFILMHKVQDKPAEAAADPEVLRVGLQERRQDRRRPGLRADARRGEGADREAVGRRDQGRLRQDGRVQVSKRGTEAESAVTLRVPSLLQRGVYVSSTLPAHEAAFDASAALGERRHAT